MQNIEIDYKDLVLQHCKKCEGEGLRDGFFVRRIPNGYRLTLRDGDFSFFTEVSPRTDAPLYWEAMARMLRIDKPQWLHERVEDGVSREIARQRAAGKKFLSDEEIAALVDEVMSEHIGG